VLQLLLAEIRQSLLLRRSENFQRSEFAVCGVSTLPAPTKYYISRGPRRACTMSSSLNALFTGMPDTAQFILEKSGGSHDLQSICKLRACSKSFHKHMKEMYAQQKALHDTFVSDSSAAYVAVHHGDRLESSFKTMKTYLDKPFFFAVMQAMLKKSVKAYCDRSETPEAALYAMDQTRLLLETYDWVRFCEHIQMYHQFHDIVHAFLDYILDIVMDVGINFVRYFGRDEITRKTYDLQQDLILANMENHGVVQCLWAVCAHHSTRPDLQVKLMHVLNKMILPSSLCHVKNVLKNPGSMRVFEDIMLNTKARPPRSQMAIIYNENLNHYAELVFAMFSSDPVFEVDEEIRVVGAAHAILEKCLRSGCISTHARNLLLECICTFTSDSTVRSLTNAQIAFLRDNPEIQSTYKGNQLVSKLLYREFTANNSS